MNKGVLFGVGLISVGFGAWFLWGGPTERDLKTPTVDTRMHGKAAGAPATPVEEIIVPQLSSAAQMGQVAFDNNCAGCHGAKAAGSDKGPPLIHKIYEPSHHGDFAFLAAAKNGVRAHHWRFGDMQPVPGVTDKQVEWIVRYVREMQRANGIN